MRTLLVAAALSLALNAAALAQASAPVYPLPPPEPSVITTPGGRDVVSPAISDRNSRCLQYAASIGVPSDKLSDYLKRCALQ